MANWAATTHNTLANAKTAIETVDETKQIHLLSFLEGAHQKIGIINKG